MKFVVIAFLLAVVVFVECGHTFLGTNVQRPLMYHISAEYGAKAFQKRVENVYYAIPPLPINAGRFIQGILAYDMKNSGASANITQGGVGQQFVNIRMKSDRGSKLHYDIYIYG